MAPAIKLALAALLAVATLLAVMNLSQTEMLFPTDAVPRAGPLPQGAAQLELNTPNGDRLQGVHFRPNVSGAGPRTLILGFGGNAWNGQHVAEYLHQLYPQAEVVAFHYRGYRPSTGSPSAKALLADAPLIHAFAVERVKPDRTFAVGFSIGAGVAASLAGRRPLNGLILVTPFDSLKAAAGDLYPWLPIGPFFEHEMNAATYLKDAQLPVAILAGERDSLIRPARTEALRREIPNLAYDRTIQGAGHNDIYARPDFQAAMREALAVLD